MEPKVSREYAESWARDRMNGKGRQAGLWPEYSVSVSGWPKGPGLGVLASAAIWCSLSCVQDTLG